MERDAARVAARAFMDDPFYRWLEPDARRRERILVGLMRRALAGCSLSIEGAAEAPVGLIAVHDPDVAPPGGGWSLALLGLLARPRRAWHGLGCCGRWPHATARAPPAHRAARCAEAARSAGVARRPAEPVLARVAARDLTVHLDDQP
jgi:hypothetical protein